MKARLVETQHEYLLRLVSGQPDAEYLADRIRIGEAHERVRLEPRWYLGAYAIYSSALTPLVIDHFRAQPGQAERALVALEKILLLDVQLAMEAFILRRERQLEYLTRELARSSRDLERSFEEQGAELRETTERARAAEQLASIGTLVAGLAHEIGTPMGVIQGHAEMLESSVSDERGRWRLQTIREQIERISGILQTLLDMARPREPQRSELDLREVIEGSLAFLREKLQRRAIEVEVDFTCPATLEGDAQKLQQVFLNLFLNAADAMPEGGTLRVHLGRADDGRIEVVVADSGQGMPEEVRARVFDPFFTTKPAGHGNGLGLMVAQGIVQEHRGTITVTSEPERGSAFCIRLQPLEQASS